MVHPDGLRGPQEQAASSRALVDDHKILKSWNGLEGA